MTVDTVSAYIGRAVARSGFRREKFTEEDAPNSCNDITIVPFFYDFRSEFILASLILNQYKELKKPYLIVCSWPGHSCLYPYADEYWSVKDESVLESLAKGANEFENKLAAVYEKTLLKYFDNVVMPSDDELSHYYKKGLTAKYLRDFGEIKYSLPSVPALDLAARKKFADHNKPLVFISPTRRIRSWKLGRQEMLLTKKEFWVHLIKKLIKAGYFPVIYQNYMTYDLSTDVTNDCYYFVEPSFQAVLSTMRVCDCVVDIFNGLSRFAYVARCPFIAYDERQRYSEDKEFEIDDLCGEDVPRQYLFGFAPVMQGQNWDTVVDALLNKIGEFIPKLDRNNWPSTAAFSKTCSYNNVRHQKKKKRFLYLHKTP